MRVVIFEPNHKGHYYAYLSLLLPRLRQTGADVILATSKAGLESNEYRTLLKPIESSFVVDPSLGPEDSRGARAAFDKAGRISDAAHRHRADHLIVTHSDRFSLGLLMRRLAGRPFAPAGCESQGLFFSVGLVDPFDRPLRRAFVRSLLPIAAAGPYTHFHHLDPRVIERLHASGSASSRRWSLMPDPVERPDPLTTAQARAMLAIPEDGRAVGCAGIIDRRKGADLLIRAFARSVRAPSDRLLLVGPHEQFIRDMLAADHADLVRDGRILSVDRFLPPAQLATAICAMDLVATPYPRHLASASIVIRAAAAGRPVLGASFGWVGDLVPRLGLGWTCDVENPDAFAPALAAAIDQSQAWRLSPAAARFVQFHSPENFAACWTARVRERMNLAPEPRVEWASVLDLLPDRRIVGTVSSVRSEAAA